MLAIGSTVASSLLGRRLVVVKGLKCCQVVGEIRAALATTVRFKHVREIDALDHILLLVAEILVIHQVGVGPREISLCAHLVQVATVVKLCVQDIGSHLATIRVSVEGLA
mgnify:CR=1 FL=1